VVSEPELCQRVGLGRTPVREAIQRLAAQRLLRVLPRRGLVVAGVDGIEHLGMLETRRVLDRLIAALAARRASPDQRAELKACATSMAKSARENRLKDYLKMDQQCDEILESACRNPSAVLAVAPLHVHCRRFWYLHRRSADIGSVAALHIALMKAVAGGDEQGAATASEALLDHLDRSAREALELH